MPKKSITKNYLYNLTYQILILVLPLITTPYLASSWSFTIWPKRNCICTRKKAKEKKDIFRTCNL